MNWVGRGKKGKKKRRVTDLEHSKGAGEPGSPHHSLGKSSCYFDREKKKRKGILPSAGDKKGKRRSMVEVELIRPGVVIQKSGRGKKKKKKRVEHLFGRGGKKNAASPLWQRRR